ncbi:hypothetical protein VPH35_133785 [Triticum aestivum]|uniref:uncharacterized protein isoform X2 n=1 Tax=Triticum aestivum TaxID=4565 RepID=UPI0008436AC6|nr:uncharacterized protein LOC123156835 isoform X2 [Triticum aestivum]
MSMSSIHLFPSYSIECATDPTAAAAPIPLGPPDSACPSPSAAAAPLPFGPADSLCPSPSAAATMDDFVLRSGVRVGLKREFAFAIASQAALAPSLGRTRSSRSSTAAAVLSPPTTKPKPSSRSSKRSRPSASAPAKRARSRPPDPDPAAADPPRDPPPPPAAADADVPVDAPFAAATPIANGPQLPPAAADGDAPVRAPLAAASPTANGPQPPPAAAVAVAGDEPVLALFAANAPTTSAPQPPPQQRQQEEAFFIPPETPPRRVTRSMLSPAPAPATAPPQPARPRPKPKPMLKPKQEPVDEPTDHLQPYPGGLTGGVASPASPRRFTRSLLQQVKQPPTDDGDNDESGTTTASSSPSPSPKSKSTKRGASLKAKSEGPDGIPKNLRELFATGLLEGQPVNYFMNKGKRPVLRGVIKDTGILCSCTSCKGRNVVSPFYFEVHAGSHKKRPSDYIFLESGNTLHDVLRACTDATVDTLESAILGAIGPVPKKRTVTCQDCKSSFKTSRAGKFASFCEICLESKEVQSTARPRGRPPKNLSPGTKTTSAASPTSSYGAKTTRAGSPTSYGRVPRNFYPVAKTISAAASPTSSGRVPKNFSPGSKPTSAGRITRKDHGLHKLVFMSGVLAEGTDVGYYVQGKRLLDGHITEHGIYCYCCNTVVSPSQFEGHAGRAARRKPYHNIYISNGVSLHELSVSLSKGRKPSEKQNDDLCTICSDGGELLLCDSCPRAFHRECVGLSSVPKGAWCCRYCENRQQREGYLAYNNNAIAAGRVDGVDSIGQIFMRSIRIATAPQGAFGGCALCKQHDFGKRKFSERTVLLCDQCGREYHVGCLKEHNMADLTALPEGAWFCSTVCVEICEALKDLVSRGAEPVPAVDADLIKKKRAEKGLNDDGDLDVRWRVLRDKSSEDSKLVLSKAVGIFHESFDPIIQAGTGRDLIPAMVYGRSVRDQDYTGMYCAVLTVGKTVVSAGLFRVMGNVAAELPLVATSRDNQGLGYFQALFACIERVLSSLKVKHFVLPAAEEAVLIWTQRFGFGKITQDKLLEYLKGGRPTVFHGTSTLHKPIPVAEAEAEADARVPEEEEEAPVPVPEEGEPVPEEEEGEPVPDEEEGEPVPEEEEEE